MGLLGDYREHFAMMAEHQLLIPKLGSKLVMWKFEFSRMEPNSKVNILIGRRRMCWALHQLAVNCNVFWIHPMTNNPRTNL